MSNEHPFFDRNEQYELWLPANDSSAEAAIGSLEQGCRIAGGITAAQSANTG